MKELPFIAFTGCLVISVIAVALQDWGPATYFAVLAAINRMGVK